MKDKKLIWAYLINEGTEDEEISLECDEPRFKTIHALVLIDLLIGDLLDSGMHMTEIKQYLHGIEGIERSLEN